MRALPLLLVAFALSIAATAPAAALKPWIGLDGSVAKYSMDDLNRQLEALNTPLVGTSLHLWPIGGGPGFGVKAGVDFGRGFTLGAGYDRVFASSGASDPSTYVKVRVPA